MSHRPSMPLSRRQLLVGAAATGVVALGRPTTAGAGGAAHSPTSAHGAELLTEWMRVLYANVRSERLTPPGAARAYAHVALAGYEAVVGGMPRHRSLAGRLNGLPTSPRGGAPNWAIAANEAMGIAAGAVFEQHSEGARAALADHTSATASRLAAGVPRGVVHRSVVHGRAVGDAVAGRARHDQYAETRGLAYDPPVGPDKWIRTPPNFGSAIEPYWGRIVSFTLTANDECKPPTPIPYSEEPGSPFWQQALATKQAVDGLDAEQRQTALFWRDNPDGTTGLPSGHWMLTACAVIDQEDLDLGTAAEVLVLTGLALADGFTSCWTEKYETNLLRPVTYIQRLIEPTWASFVNSPAFPEYTSGHSVGSAAAAQVLTELLGEIPYTDEVGVPNGFPARRFGSFWEAAYEAANSRLLGGIHYPMGIEAGLDQGTAVAEKVLERARTRRRRHER